MPDKLKSVTNVVAVLLISLITGLFATTGSIKQVGGFVGVILAMFLLFSPLLLFGTVLIFSLVISGLAEFYLGIGQANWLASILALTLIVAVLISRMSYRKHSNVNTSKSVGPLVITYLIILVSASVLNSNSIIQFIVGLRNYIPFVGVFLALSFLSNSGKELKLWVYLIIFVGLVQLPFCLHQAIFIAPMRQYSLEAIGGGAESIVGTFGGDPFGGGYTGEMAIYMLLASCLSLILRSQVRFGKLLSWVICLAAIICVALAETKIVFLLTPLVLALVFFEDIQKSPKKLFGFLFGMFIALGSIAIVYAWRFWSQGPEEFWHAFTYSFDPNFMVDPLHRGRVGALVHWWSNNIVDFDLFHALIGYGMSSTLESSRVLGEGSAVSLYGVGLDAHAANKLLWDVGILGFVLFCLLILRTALNAHRLVGKAIVPQFHLAVLKVSRAAMFCFAAILPYQVSVLGGAPMQYLFWFFIGYVEYWRRMEGIDNQ